MRLYIATTTLNFDSIMATESMSPGSFYERRGFGISLFYSKVSFQLKNSILLFDSFPNYRMSDQEVEHHQLVIEIDDSNYPGGTFKKVKDNDGFSVYQATTTLYITPLSCKIYFYTEKDMRASLAKADSIIEAKYLLYKRMGSIMVADSNIIRPVALSRQSLDGIADCPDVDYKAMEFDRRVDKAKGFLVSYMIGASKALSVDSARLLRLVKDIKNSIYSIGTKDNTTSTSSSYASLRSLTTEADAISNRMDARKQEANMRLYETLRKIKASEKLNGATEEAILSFLKAAGVFSSFYQMVNGTILEFPIASYVTAAINAEDDLKQEEAVKRLEYYAKSLVQYVPAADRLEDLFSVDPDLKVIECKDASLPEKSRKELNVLYNLFSGTNVSSSEIRTNRVNFVVDAGTALNISDGPQDDKDYFNALLDNLEHAAKFDLMSSSDPTLQALAAFMRSPDVDIDKMVSLLVNSEVADPRVAYGLWGLFYGYSSIRKDYFDAFVKNYKDAVEVGYFVNQIYSAIFHLIPSFPVVEEKKVEKKEEKSENGFIQKMKQKLGFSSSKEEDTVNDTSAVVDMPEEVYTGMIEFPDETPASCFVTEESVKEAGSSFRSSKEQILSTTSVMTVPVRDVEDDMPSRYADLAVELEEVIKKYLPSKEKEKAEYIEYYSNEVRRICRDSDTIVGIINGVNQIQMKYGKTVWNTKARIAIVKYLKEMEKREMDTVLDMRLYSASVSSSIPLISDKAAVEFVKRFVKLYVVEDEITSTKIVDSFKKFYADYQPGRYFYNNPDKYQRDNKSVIEHWTYWCFSEKNYYNRLPDDLRQIVNAVANKLKETYRCGE